MVDPAEWLIECSVTLASGIDTECRRNVKERDEEEKLIARLVVRLKMYWRKRNEQKVEGFLIDRDNCGRVTKRSIGASPTKYKHEVQG